MTTVDDLLDDITGRQRCTTSDALSTELSARRLGHSQSAFDTNISSQQPGESLLCYFLRLKGLKNYAPVKKFSARPSKEVWIVADADNVQHVAKVLNMELMSPNERRFAMNEVKCLAQCHHPNIIRYVHDFEYEGMILLIMELALAGDLSLQVHARSRNRAFFRRHEALVVFCQLCLSIDYIHNQNMMHRDIKSENIFITSAGVLKLGDFGFTRQYDVTLSGTPGGTFCGTPHYLSPEICTHRPYGRKSDLFSAGVVLYELLALERPFKGATIAEIMGNVVAGRYIPVNKMNPDCGEDMAHLCHGLLALDPEQRLSLQDIFSASFIRVALSELRVAVLGMTKIPDSDRCAIQSHIERILSSTTCAGVRWLAMEGHTLLDDPSGNLYELVITASEPKAQSDRAHYLSLRPWRPLIPHYEREGNGRTPVETPILGSIVEIDMRNIQSIEIYRDEDYVNGDVIQIKMTTPPSHITHEMLKGFTNREWFLRAQSPREAMQCLKSLEFM